MSLAEMRKDPPSTTISTTIRSAQCCISFVREPPEPRWRSKAAERDGLVERVADADDKRARVVKLTPEGFAFWNELRQRIFQFYDQAVSKFRFDDCVALAHYLNELQRQLLQVRLETPRRPRNKTKKRL
jgi:hypothetical protein